MPLGLGSIAFVGFNADGNDNIAFVALQDIAAGEAIIFEDNEWNGAAFADTNENAFIWTATTPVTAGAVVLLNNVGADSPSASTGTVVFGASATYGSNHGLGNSGETLYAYAGTRAAPTFITAVTNNGEASGSLANTGLTYGVNALNLGLRDADGDIFAWKGARDGYADFDALRTALNATPTAANWDAQDASGDQSADGTTPDAPFPATGFSVQAPSVLLSESFDGFTAAGFAPTPAAGQLDSDVWRVAGLSDNANPAYGFTAASGDFARGLVTNDPTSAGVYSKAGDGALIFQPTGAEMDVGGFVEARIQNTTGATLTSVEVEFDWIYRNNAPRSDNLQLSYSTDGVTFTAAPAANFSTPAAAVAGASFTAQAEALTLSGLNVASGGALFLRWTHLNSEGSGNRDEVGLDNLVVTAGGGGGGGPGATTVSIADASVVEGDSGTKQLVFTVTRSDNAGDFTLDYTTANGTATAGSDYVGVSGAPNSLHFTAGGALTQQIAITVNGDTAAESNETFSVNLGALTNGSGTATIADGTAQGTIVDDDGYTRIYAIQGSGAASTRVGETVVTQGVVTAVDTTSGGPSGRGFWIQDAAGDGQASTSDAVFVFMPTGTLPGVGRLVQVSGTVQEFTPNGAAVGALSTTELVSVTSVVDLGAGPAISAVQIGGPGGLLPPTSDIAEGVAFYESLEGMLVKVTAPIAVAPSNNFGEIFTVVDNDGNRDNGLAGTNSLTPRGGVVVSGGQSVFGDTNVVGGDFNPERIQIDADSGVLPGFTKPLVDTGAQLSDVTGVVNYSFGNYEVLATQAYTVATPSTLQRETGDLQGDGNHLLVVSYNAENLDAKLEDINKVANKSSSNVDDDLGSGKFDTIANQLFNTLHAPDIVALQEIQDNDGGEISGVSSASVTLQTLVDKLNALASAAGSSAHYAYVDNVFINNSADGTANGGQPGGNIRAAFLYRDDRVDLMEGSVRTIAADGSAITTPGGYSDQLTNPDNPFYNSRPPLAATFTFNGEEVTVVNNHFTSKGGSAALMGRDQPPFDAGEVSRAAQAQAVNTFIDGILAKDTNAKVVVAGDLNEFQFEEPMSVLKGTGTITNYNVPGDDPIEATATYTPGGAAILSDLLDLLPANQRYDYVFEGNSQSLDHLLVSNSLAGKAQFDIVRLNAEFASQTSDHDPLAALLRIGGFTVRTGETVTVPQTLGAGETGTVQTDGALTVAASGSANIAAVTWTGGVSTLVNDGLISATAGSGASRGLDTSGSLAAGSSLTVENGAGAKILSATNDALRINSDIPNGTIVVRNDGVIVSGVYSGSEVTGTRSGQAIDFNALTSASAHTTIVNGSGALIGAASADAIRPGVNATIENHGLIIAKNGGADSSSDGVDFQDLGFGSVHNFAGGQIVAARHGVTAKQALVIDNDAGASITGQLGSGINLDTPAASTTIVRNAGSITGTAAGATDGDGVDVDGLVDIDNSGLIEALGTWSGGLSEAISVGGGTIDNAAGGVIRSTQRAITIDNSDLGPAYGATTLTNLGLIQGGAGEAIKITGAFADTLTNKGVIVGAVDLGGGDDVVNAYAGSSLSGELAAGAGTDVVNLYGPGAGAFGPSSSVETLNVHGGDWTIEGEGFGKVVLQTGAQTIRLAANVLADGAFTGAISGFGGDDQIALRGVGQGTGATLGVGNLLTIAGVAGGLVTLQLDPAADYAGKLFVVSSDGAGGSLVKVVDSVAPTATADAAAVVEDGSVAIDVLANDIDPDAGDAKTLVSVSATAKGAEVSIVDGKVVYAATADVFDVLTLGQNTTDSFTYTMKDAAGLTSSATVTVTVNGAADGAAQAGGNGADPLTGTTLDEKLDGGNGNDTLSGLGGADSLLGGNGADLIQGGAGIDSLSGANDADTLSGGLGDDVLAGGRGADQFLFENAFGRDTLVDFKAGEDVIRFTGGTFTSFVDLLSHAAQSGANVVISAPSGVDALQLNNVQLSSLQSSDFLFA